MFDVLPLLQNARPPTRCARLEAEKVVAITGWRICGERFNTRDRCDVLAWQTGPAGTIRIVVHQLSASDTGCGGDFLLAYRPREIWASWGMARQDGRLLVWCCAAGEDLGPYSSIESALRTLSVMTSSRWKKKTCSA